MLDFGDFGKKRTRKGHIIGNHDTVNARLDTKESGVMFYNKKFNPNERLSAAQILLSPKNIANGVPVTFSCIQKLLTDNFGKNTGKKNEEEEYRDLVPFLAKCNVFALENDVDTMMLQPNEAIPVTIGGISTIELKYKPKDTSQKRVCIGDLLCPGVILPHEAVDENSVGKFTLKKHDMKMESERCISSLFEKKREKDPKTKRVNEHLLKFAKIFLGLGLIIGKNHAVNSGIGDTNPNVFITYNDLIDKYFGGDEANLSPENYLDDYKPAETGDVDDTYKDLLKNKNGKKFMTFLSDLTLALDDFKKSNSLAPVCRVIEVNKQFVNVKWL